MLASVSFSARPVRLADPFCCALQCSRKNVGFYLGSRRAASITANASAEEQKAPCLYVRRTIKSGETLECGGAVVVFGDVEKGAAVLADGDIVVVGQVFGDCHAGRNGNTEAVVFSLGMNPKNISICNDTEISIQKMNPFRSAEIASRTSYRQAQTSGVSYIADKLLHCSRPGRAALFTGAYIFVAGICFFMFPKTLFGVLFKLENVALGWIQAAAVLAVVFGIYYIGTAIGDSSYAFYMSTVVGRIFLFCSFCWLVLRGSVPPGLLIVGTINLVGALYMLKALIQGR